MSQVQTEPFGHSIVGKWQKGDVVRFSISSLGSVPLDKNTLYLCTPHTFLTPQKLAEVKARLVDTGHQVVVESLWTGFTEFCGRAGFKCIPSYYELGLNLQIATPQKVAFPTHFGRSVLYESIGVKGFELLEGFLERRYRSTQQKTLVTAGQVKTPVPQLIKGKPWVDVQIFPATSWMNSGLAIVGCNVTATSSEAGPRLFTYSARMGIGTVFLRKSLSVRMGNPILLLRPYAFVAESEDDQAIEAQIQAALAFRGKTPLKKETILQVISSELSSLGYQVSFF